MKKDFLEILRNGSNKELEEYLLSKGKGPKPICPIMFINKNEEEKEEWKQDQN